MRHSSLTVRLTAMFMCAVVAVLAVAGFSFNELSRRHFTAIDRQTLVEKLESTIQIMSGQSGSADKTEIDLQLRALLGAHPELTAVILASDGSELFSAPASANLPDLKSATARDDIWEWSNQGHMYRGMTSQFRTLHQERPVTLWLILDVTNHMHFFDTLRWWLWIGLILSGVVSAALGWLVARSGLKPLDRVTQIATSMSAKSLKERIPLGPVPSELQELISSFNAMLARLDESFVRLSNFSADIAHELRTPISNLRTHTEVVLSKKRAPEAYEDNLYSNLEDLNRISSIIDAMLLLAKSDNGLIVPARVKVELKFVAEKLFEFYQLLADEKDIQLVVIGAGSVLGDGVMLDRVISNLLSNALRYTPPGEMITIKILEGRETVSITVSNPGESISPEHLNRLFDRFYRIDPARREGYTTNSGLGLAIARSLVEAHGGKIWCVSLNGVTAFCIELPREPN